MSCPAQFLPIPISQSQSLVGAPGCVDLGDFWTCLQTDPKLVQKAPQRIGKMWSVWANGAPFFKKTTPELGMLKMLGNASKYSNPNNASAGNRTQVTSMATMYSTTRPLMLLVYKVICWNYRIFFPFWSLPSILVHFGAFGVVKRRNGVFWTRVLRLIERSTISWIWSVRSSGQVWGPFGDNFKNKPKPGTGRLNWASRPGKASSMGTKHNKEDQGTTRNNKEEQGIARNIKEWPGIARNNQE